MKTLTILSGKGGVGKTMLASSLAVLFAKELRLVACDCDVDASNLALALGIKESSFVWEEIETSEKAKLIEEKCNGCKKCLNSCVFSAIHWNEEKNKPEFNRFLCEGCGACSLVCPKHAIEIERVKNGRMGSARSKYGFAVVSGQLKMGESGSGKIVDMLKERALTLAEKERAELLICDSAAGISCPVIASLRGSDFVIAVTEPSPASFRDLKRALQIVQYFNIPYGIVINKWDINKRLSKEIEGFAGEKLLGQISYDRKVVDAIVNLTPVVETECKAAKEIVKIKERVKTQLYKP
ncbi:MAG: ATP-binding protein [Candidatus Diapherotrites archaeon]|nr:ATP-binding protein [Candidatus Diapherotrites archaeon]